MPLSDIAAAAYSKLWAFVADAAGTKTDSGAYAYTSTDVVSAAAQIYREAGQALTFAETSAIPGLFSMARSQFRSADALFAADNRATITSSMIGEWPTAPSLAVQAAQPMYMAKAQFTYTNALGVESTGWISVTGITQLPTSAGGLRLMLQGKAMQAYATPPGSGGTPTTDAEVMTEWGAFTQIQLYEM